MPRKTKLNLNYNFNYKIVLCVLLIILLVCVLVYVVKRRNNNDNESFFIGGTGLLQAQVAKTAIKKSEQRRKRYKEIRNRLNNLNDTYRATFFTQVGELFGKTITNNNLSLISYNDNDNYHMSIELLDRLLTQQDEENQGFIAPSLPDERPDNRTGGKGDNRGPHNNNNNNNNNNNFNENNYNKLSENNADDFIEGIVNPPWWKRLLYGNNENNN
jgi:hypothetical protein